MNKVVSLQRSIGNVVVVDELEVWRKYLSVVLKEYSLTLFDNVSDCLDHIHVTHVDCVIIGMGVDIYPGIALSVVDEFPDIQVIYLPDRQYEFLDNYTCLHQKYNPVTPDLFRASLLDLILL